MNSTPLTASQPVTTAQTGHQAHDAPSGLLDFDSDEPLAACPLRNNGDTICESCQ